MQLHWCWPFSLSIWKSFVHKVQELSLIFEIQFLVSSNFVVQWMISINHSTKKSLFQPYYSKNVFSDLKVLKLFQLILCLCNSTFTMWWRWRKKSSNCLDRNFFPTFAVAQLSTYIPLQKVGSTPLQEFQVLRVCRSLKGLSCPTPSFASLLKTLLSKVAKFKKCTFATASDCFYWCHKS